MSGHSDAEHLISRRNLLRGAGALATSASLAALGCSKPGTPSANDPTGVTTALAGASEGTLSAAEVTTLPIVGPRSLVCVMLRGGSDSFNMFAPLDFDGDGNDHATYARTRGPLAVNAGELLGIGDGQFGLHPGLPGLAERAGEGRLAVVSNVGTLQQPTTRDDVLGERSLPQSLFAHDAQQKLWQTGRPTLTTGSGWGGSIVESITANGAGGVVSPSFSIAGSSIWLSARQAPYSRLSPTVQIQRMRGYDHTLGSRNPHREGLSSLMAAGVAAAAASTNLLEQAAGERLATARITTEALQEATSDEAGNDVGMDGLDGNRLGRQLRQVARLIRNRESLGMERQVFFVHMGGWDTHGEQAERFPVLLAELDGALSSFQTSLDSMGVADTVTTFTMSDFGRTLTSNGDGTDHGWGGHAFVMGSAVEGGVYGTMPNFSGPGNPDDAGDVYGNFAGRIIPTTSVSQYGATMARWMGLDDAQLDLAFPELGAFEQRDLGFFRA